MDGKIIGGNVNWFAREREEKKETNVGRLNKKRGRKSFLLSLFHRIFQNCED